MKKKKNNISNQCFGKSTSTYFLVIIFKMNNIFLTIENVLDMKKLWVNCFLLFISMATAEKLNDTIKKPTGNEQNCTTRKCVKDNLEFELNMLENINPSVDPCDDFYEFACGNFDDVPDDIVQIRQHKRFHYAFEDMIHKMFYKISESNSSDSFKPFNFLRDFLISCERLNNNNNALHPGIKEDKLEYLKEIISKLGGWPVVEGHKWNETNDNWTKFIDEAKNVHYLPFHFYGLRSRSIKNRTIIFFNPANLEFPYENIRNRQNNRTINAYHNFMVYVANLLGANKTQAEIELAESLEFELKLAYISTENIASKSNKYDVIELSVKEIIEIWPSIDWMKLFNSESYLPSDITNETQVFVKNYVDVTNLEELVNNTPARVRANYAIWKTIQNLIPMIESASLAQVMQIYNKVKNPSYFIEPMKCVEMLQQSFPELMIAHYVRNYPVDKLVKIHVHQLISYLEQKFFDTLNITKWLDLKTRDTLLETINSLKFVIGYFDEIMDDKKLIEYFQGLNITPDNFLKNILNRKIFAEKKRFSLSHKPKDSIGFAENFYVLTSLTSDAFFHEYTKTIGIELLRNLFFSIHRPNYVTLAVLGSKIAHEIGHSIDRSYHVNKFRVKASKWSESSKQEYYDIRECIAQQYSNYYSKVTGNKINGEFYLNENIADNIGAQVAYSAYQDLIQRHGPEPTFSSLPYNSNQLFWLSFANQWCWPKSTLENWRSTDEHPLSAHRVIIPLSNSPEFSKDFNCPLGSNMNPVKKCIVL